MTDFDVDATGRPPIEGGFPDDMARILSDSLGFQPVNCAGILIPHPGGMAVSELAQIENPMELVRMFNELVQRVEAKWHSGISTHRPDNMVLWYWTPLEPDHCDDLPGVGHFQRGAQILDTMLSICGTHVLGIHLAGTWNGIYRVMPEPTVAHWHTWDLRGTSYVPLTPGSLEKTAKEGEEFWGIVSKIEENTNEEGK